MPYAAPPGPRMAYDRDGTGVFSLDTGTGTIITPSAASVTRLNSEDPINAWQDVGGPNQGSNNYIVFLFPESRDVVGWYARSTDGGSSTGETIETSTDTTNGLDGTWTALTTTGGYPQEAISPNYRTHINAVTSRTCTAIRFKHNGDSFNDFGTVHIYGAPTAAGDFMEAWHPTLDQRLPFLDWGDVVQGNVATATFRIKNRSTVKTAGSVLVSMEALTEASPTQVSQHAFSLDGTTFAATRTITSIAPGAISGVVTVKRTTSASAQLGLYAQRILAVPATFA